MFLCTEKNRFGKNNVAWRGTNKIKYMYVEDYGLALYIFSNIIIVTKITLGLLCCHGPYSHGKLPQAKNLHLYQMKLSQPIDRHL